ncbi:hypothetical protein AeMF1_021439 [Aphanomyces euteiches]|nr:hypothetical protein AeMF1_021439 [Aphanomyces euteiches]
MDRSRLNVLMKRQKEAHAAQIENEYSSSRGAIAVLVMLVLLGILPSVSSLTLTTARLIFIVLPGYTAVVFCALIALKSLYVAVIKQVAIFQATIAASTSSTASDQPANAASSSGLRQRKFVVPEVDEFPSSSKTSSSTPAIVSTAEELARYQQRKMTAEDESDSKLNFGFGMEMSSAINPNGLYAQPYAVMKPTAKPPARKELDSALSSAPHVDKAHEVLAECKIKPRHMGNLCDTLRHVLAQHLQDVLGNLSQNMDELMKMGLRRDVLVDLTAVQPVLSIQVPGEAAPRTLRNISMKQLLNMGRTEPIFASKTRPNIHLLREYETLMKYFDVKEEYNTTYAIERLQTLGEDGFLGPYRWDSGGKWKGKPWTKESMLPSDAELIMNLFCAMLDDVLPATCDTDRPFRRAHYAPSPPTKSASIRGMFLIFCSQTTPPNFKVIANGAVWEILPGKTNVFQAIVLFLHAVKQFKSGHLGNINLHVLLEEIFDS